MGLVISRLLRTLTAPFLLLAKVRKPGVVNQSWERTLAVAVDEANAAADAERHEGTGDHLPHCDLTVWLRDYRDEVREPIPGRTTGDMPPWLRGTLVRNGPGAQSVCCSTFKHLFDCSAALHRFEMKDGKVTYQSRLLRSKTLETNLAAGRIAVSEFGTARTPDPCRTIFRRFASYLEIEESSDNCLVSVYPFGDEVYVLTESPRMYRIDPDNLQTICPKSYPREMHIVHHTSHPLVAEDGLVTNLGLSVSATGPAYTILQLPNTRSSVRGRGLDPLSEAEVVARAPCRWPLHPSYMHSFGATQNYYVLVEQPLAISVPAKIASHFTSRPLSSLLSWYPDQPTEIRLLDKRTGRQRYRFLAEPLFYLHLINSYEEDGYLVLDICGYKDPSMIDCMFIESLKTAKENPDYAKMFRGRPVRFVLPLGEKGGATGANLVALAGSSARAVRLPSGDVRVEAELLSDMGCETPRLNHARQGHKYRYFYAISADVDLPSPGTLIKVDVENKTKKIWTEKGIFPSEPIFVPSPNAMGEDDGVVLSTLLWAQNPQQVALLVLDAKCFTELSRSVFVCPGPVPKCLHGWFFPNEADNLKE